MLFITNLVAHSGSLTMVRIYKADLQYLIQRKEVLTTLKVVVRIKVENKP